MLVASLLFATGPWGSRAVAGKASFEKMACSIPEEQLLRTWHGIQYEHSGDVQVLPIEPNFLGGGLPHAGPWDYVQEIPMFWYGPGFIKARGSVARPVTLADIAPTQADILQFDGFDAPDGEAMTEALDPAAKGKPPPRLLVTIVWDATGRDVLDTWKKDYPYLDSLIDEGTWYEHATLGASPADTPPGHGSIGTGALPFNHGLLDQHQRIGNTMTGPWSNGPNLLILPTLADLYDLAMDNKPKVGALSSLSSHLGMLGHGSMWGGGDKDIAVTHENLTEEGSDAGVEWGLRPGVNPWFRFPKYVNDFPPVQQYTREVDQQDGAADGKWLTTPFTALQLGWDSPARTPYQTTAIEAVVKREKFGKDKIPDLLFINYKVVDQVGHKFSINSPEMADSVKVNDDALRILVKFFNRQVGRHKWALVLTADHGHQFDPKVTGAYPINPKVMQPLLDEHFGGPVVQEIRPTQIWLDHKEAQRLGVSETEVSDYIMTLTKADIPTTDVTTPASEQGEKLFEAAFPTSVLARAPCLKGVPHGPTPPGRQPSEEVAAGADQGSPSPKEPEPEPGGGGGQVPASP